MEPEPVPGIRAGEVAGHAQIVVVRAGKVDTGQPGGVAADGEAVGQRQGAGNAQAHALPGIAVADGEICRTHLPRSADLEFDAVWVQPNAL